MDHSLGWVVAREDEALVGLVNVVWDGFIHAWLQDTMVAASASRSGVGTQLVAAARDAAKEVSCEFLLVDVEPDLQSFYIESCGFAPALAGVMRLVGDDTPHAEDQDVAEDPDTSSN